MAAIGQDQLQEEHDTLPTSQESHVHHGTLSEGGRDDAIQDNRAGQTAGDNRTKMMRATVKAWREENVYKTKAVTATKQKILSEKCVCIVGVPGAGKSTAIYHAALYLEDEGFIIYPIDESKELIDYFDENRKQVFILDNVLGVYSVLQSEVDFWVKQDGNIRKVLGTNTKLLVSIRTQLFNQVVKGNDFVFFDKSSCIDFCDETYRMNSFDMKCMLTHYLTVKNIVNVDDLIRPIFFPNHTEKELQNMTEEDRQRIMSRNIVDLELLHSFPLLCKVFCSDKSLRQKPREFFKNPFHALTKIFRKIDSDNKLQFCGLVLCAIFDGKLTEDMFSSTCEDNDENDVKLRNVIMKDFHLEGHLLEIKSALNALDGVYITHIENSYKMAHTVFHDVVTCLFNDTDPSFVLKYCTREFIRDRIRISKTQPENDPYMIIMYDDKNVQRLADRLFIDLKSDTNKGAEFIARNPNIDHDKLITYLGRNLFSISQSDKKLMNELFRKCMLTVWYTRHTYKNGYVTQYKFIELCVQSGVDCNMHIGAFGLYPLHISVTTGSLQLTQLLLQNGADKRIVDWEGDSFLHWVCSVTKYNTLDLIKLLTHYGGYQSVVKIITNDKHKILQELERCNGNLQLEEVLPDSSIKILTNDKQAIKQFVDCYTGKLQLVELVHDNILTYTDRKGRSVLHWSVHDYVVTDYLLTHQCLQLNINQRDYKNRTAYWYIVNNKKLDRYGDTEDVVIENKENMIQLFDRHGAML